MQLINIHCGEYIVNNGFYHNRVHEASSISFSKAAVVVNRILYTTFVRKIVNSRNMSFSFAYVHHLVVLTEIHARISPSRSVIHALYLAFCHIH